MACSPRRPRPATTAAAWASTSGLLPLFGLCAALAVAVSRVAAQTAPATARCETLATGSVCDGVLDYTSVYVPGGVCQDQVEAQQLQPLQAVFAVLSTAARDPVAQYLCAKTWPRCVTTTGSSAVSFAAPCKSVCDRASAALSSFERTLVLGQLGVVLPSDCDALSNGFGTGGASGTGPCYAGPPGTFVQRTAYQRCEPYRGTLCAGVVDYPVFVPPHMTQQSLEAQLSQSLPALYVAPPGACLTALTKFLCARAFLRCDSDVVFRGVGLRLATPFPQFPCARVCERFGRDCDAWLSSRPELRAGLGPVCNTTGTYQPAPTVCGVAQGPGPGGRSLAPDYPVASITWSVSPPLSSACNSWYDANATAQARAALVTSLVASGAQPNASVAAAAPQVLALEVDRSTSPTVSCPLPLVVPDAAALANGFVNPIGGSCALPCPTPIYTRDELYVLESVSAALLGASIAAILFLTAAWTLLRDRRKHELVLFFLWCVIGTALPFVADIVPVSGDRPDGLGRRLMVDRDTCANNVQPLDVRDTSSGRAQYCLFTGSVRQFAQNAALFWWLLQGFDLFIKVCLPTVKLPAATRYAYHAFVWSLSIGLMGVGFAMSAYGPQAPSLFCGAADDYAAWYIVYLPLGICGVLCTFFVGAVVVQLFRTSLRVRNTANARSGGRLTATTDWKAHRSIIFLLLLFDAAMIVPLLYRVVVYYEEDAIAASVADWVQCLLTVAGGTSACGDRPAERPDYGGMFVITVFASSTGLIPFAVYGVRRELYRDLAIFCCWKRRRNRCVRPLLTCVGAFEGTGDAETRTGASPLHTAVDGERQTRKAPGGAVELQYAVPLADDPAANLPRSGGAGDKSPGGSLVSPKSSQHRARAGHGPASTHQQPVSPGGGLLRHQTFGFGGGPASGAAGGGRIDPSLQTAVGVYAVASQGVPIGTATSPKSSAQRQPPNATTASPTLGGGRLPEAAAAVAAAQGASGAGTPAAAPSVSPAPNRAQTMHNNFTL